MTCPSVLLGMSGGVDSSVAAALLVEQGYTVHGITLQVWEHEDESTAVSKRWEERGCCKVGLARFAAQRMGISHEVVDIRESFETQVIGDFVRGYLNGTTPNPCVRCNERVKVRTLYDLAVRRGIDYVATGHYAQIHKKNEDAWSLHRSQDIRKDQSYFLYRLQRSWLPRLLFPVGAMQKSEIWERAEGLGLPIEELQESQEICFVSQGDYRTFLQKEAPESRRPGQFVDHAGRVLGEHEGVAYYTPGQRRGLGVAVGQRLYVHQVVPETNTVVLGPEEGLLQSECAVADLNLFDHSLLDGPSEVEVKVRYATPPVPATLTPTVDGRIKINFRVPQRALSPGQSAVFYHADRVLGGGIIQK